MLVNVLAHCPYSHASGAYQAVPFSPNPTMLSYITCTFNLIYEIN